MTRATSTILASLVSLVLASKVSAQLTVHQSAIAGGGGVSVGGTITLSGTIGQHDATATLSGGAITLVGGFWATAGPATPTCGSSDYNCDGDFGTDADIEAFFACLAGVCPPAPCTSGSDFNGDGDFGTDADIEAFFRVLGGGSC
jgi:hypothetical protein